MDKAKRINDRRGGRGTGGVKPRVSPRLEIDVGQPVLWGVHVVPGYIIGSGDLANEAGPPLLFHFPPGLGEPLAEDLLGGEEVDATQLVVIAPIAPRRALGSLLPPLRHRPDPPRASVALCLPLRIALQQAFAHLENHVSHTSGVIP